MRRIKISVVAAVVFVSSSLLSLSVRAASVEQVVAACDKMADAKPGSCNYVADDKGLGGCTRNGCFYCPADGSRQCHATRSAGKTRGPNVVVKVGTVKFSCNSQAEGWCK
jgi:hypothetical protein